MMEKKKSYHLAIVGVTGAVGQEFLRVLEKRKFPVASLKLLASSRSVGKKIKYAGSEYSVDELNADSFEGVDMALFSAGGARSREFAPAAVKAGAVVVDNSSAFRMDKNVPLVIPEINPEDIREHRGIIANPNCTTIIASMAVWPIHKLARIKKMVVSTYQAVSGAGFQAMDELKTQTEDFLSGKPLTKKIFKHQIAFNLFSHDSNLGPEGYSEEEIKVVNETRKIFHDDSILITPTAVRVPIFRAHAEAIHLELSRPVTVEEALKALSLMPGVKIVDDRQKNHFPMPVEVSGQDEVFVGRVRNDLGAKNGLNLFVCGDQILKGAALNAVQIAENLIR